MKDQPARNYAPNDQPEAEKKNIKQNNINENTDMSGTISGELQQAGNKIKASTSMEGQNVNKNVTKQPIPTDNRWEKLADIDQEENDKETTTNHEELLKQYKLITRTNQLEGFASPTTTDSYTIKNNNMKTVRNQYE